MFNGNGGVRCARESPSMRYRTGTYYLSVSILLSSSSTCSPLFHYLFFLLFFSIFSFPSLPPSHLPRYPLAHLTFPLTPLLLSFLHNTHPHSWTSNCPSDSTLSTKQREREQTRSNAPSWYTGPCSGQSRGCSQVRTLRVHCY